MSNEHSLWVSVIFVKTSCLPRMCNVWSMFGWRINDGPSPESTLMLNIRTNRITPMLHELRHMLLNIQTIMKRIGIAMMNSRLCVCAMITDLLFKCMSSHGQDGQNTRLGKVPTMLYFDGSTVYSSNFDWLSLRRIHSIILDPIMYSSE